jgi:uncharacterized membrane protein
MVPREQAQPLPIPIEDGIKLIISGGAVIDAQQRDILRATAHKLVASNVTSPSAGDGPTDTSAGRSREDSRE